MGPWGHPKDEEDTPWGHEDPQVVMGTPHNGCWGDTPRGHGDTQVVMGTPQG